MKGGKWLGIAAAGILLTSAAWYFLRTPSPEAQERYVKKHYELGEAYFAEGKKRQALRAYKRAARYSTSYAGEALYKVADIGLDLGELKESERAALRLREEHPTSHRLAQALAVLREGYLRQGRQKEALEAGDAILHSASSKEEMDFTHFRNMQVLWKMGDKEKAWEEAQRVSDKKAHFLKSDLIYHQLMIHFQPMNPQGYEGLAQAYIHLGLQSQAGPYLQKARLYRAMEKEAKKKRRIVN